MMRNVWLQRDRYSLLLLGALSLLVVPACGQPSSVPSAAEGEPSGEEGVDYAHGEILLKADVATTPGTAVARPSFDDRDYAQARRRMVAVQIDARGVDDEATLAAMRRVPRHHFVAEPLQRRAYEDGPLPIGHGQTISQPYIVGAMTEALALEPDDRVLEIGTGSGYQAAILAEIVRDVVTIEIVDELAQTVAERLETMGYTNITVLQGDGYYGWPERAPYDAIIVTAAATHIPPPLLRQLRPGGRMAIPVGRSGWTQNLLLVEKDDQGEMTTQNLMAVRFVPLTRSE